MQVFIYKKHFEKKQAKKHLFLLKKKSQKHTQNNRQIQDS